MTSSDVIREWVKDGYFAVYRTLSYSRSIATIELLMGEVRKDFPDVPPEQITLEVFTGDSIRYTRGLFVYIENPPEEIPKNFREIPCLPSSR